ncbi:hypothetical protein E2C01_009595 [Portunus trituberculatus]|uniref:Uncharacterized protein n=1 Tax=Portunus trituberculatus TaxID=210409 RepID=A0A5B7D672_PORTR|nr:hypothetical protein [Portunus trituberculatus]
MDRRTGTGRDRKTSHPHPTTSNTSMSDGKRFTSTAGPRGLPKFQHPKAYTSSFMNCRPDHTEPINIKITEEQQLNINNNRSSCLLSHQGTDL